MLTAAGVHGPPYQQYQMMVHEAWNAKYVTCYFFFPQFWMHVAYEHAIFTYTVFPQTHFLKDFGS